MHFIGEYYNEKNIVGYAKLLLYVRCFIVTYSIAYFQIVTPISQVVLFYPCSRESM